MGSSVKTELCLFDFTIVSQTPSIEPGKGWSSGKPGPLDKAVKEWLNVLSTALFHVWPEITPEPLYLLTACAHGCTIKGCHVLPATLDFLLGSSTTAASFSWEPEARYWLLLVCFLRLQLTGLSLWCLSKAL
jgi:hypothetical protein